MWKIHRQRSPLLAHLLTSKWANTRKVKFHADIWFHKHHTPWLTHAYVRGHSALTSESSGQSQHDDVASAKWILPTETNKTTNISFMMTPDYQSEIISDGLVSLRICRAWRVAVVIHAVFVSSCWIRQSKLTHATCANRKVADGFLWCRRGFLVKT